MGLARGLRIRGIESARNSSSYRGQLLRETASSWLTIRRPVIRIRAVGQSLPEVTFESIFPIIARGKLNPRPLIADFWSVGSVAKWLRQRIANPSSSVRLRPEPMNGTLGNAVSSVFCFVGDRYGATGLYSSRRSRDRQFTCQCAFLRSCDLELLECRDRSGGGGFRQRQYFSGSGSILRSRADANQ